MTDWALTPRGVRHGLHSLLLAFPIVVFSGAVLTDIAYLRSAEIQWTNFSAWLITLGTVFSGLLALWALIVLILGFRSPSRLRHLIYLAVVAAMALLGLVNAFKHSQDGWSSVGALGVILSVLCALLALIAGVIHHLGLSMREIVR